MRSHAEAGNPQAQYHYAISFQNDQSPINDYNAALDWFEKAASNGHAMAMTQAFELSVFLGQTTPLREDNLKKALNEPENEARFLLDTSMALGTPPTQRHLAIEQLNKAAKLGNVKALGLLCRYGTKGLYYVSFPLQVCESASRNGAAEAGTRLGMIYEWRHDDFMIYPSVRDRTEFILSYDAPRFKPSKEMAAYWYEQSAKKGDAKAQARLARLLASGEGRNADIGKALDWAEKSAVQDEPEGLAVLGLLLANERLTKKDAPRALALLTRAAERGNPAAMVDLIVMHTHGQDAPRDLDQALTWAYLFQEEFDIPHATEGYERLMLLTAREAIFDLKQLLTPEAALKGRRAATDLRESLFKKGLWPFRQRREEYALTY
ncbi:MAG: SEL1-like repeat protein [Alphaproteobacteria bacterium]|nr:SEL1-like repeat protein [Alphaproteobacteria bacterium]